MCSKMHGIGRSAGFTVSFLLLAGLGAGERSASAAAGEILDCVLARVNDQPITLFEVKMLEAFGLFREENISRSRDLLEKWINLKIVIDLVKERVSVPPERVAAARDLALEVLGAEEAEARLRNSGLSRDNLLPYFEQKLVYEEIIFMRFSRSTIVTLREIESYYQETYIPAERSQGREPRPILDVLDELEALLKGEKIRSQVSSWVQNLRRQADVQIMDACRDALDRE